MDYFISDDISYTSVGVLENICKGSKALEIFYQSVLQLKCELVDTDFVIQLLNFKELFRQKKFCVSTNCMLNEGICCFHKYEVIISSIENMAYIIYTNVKFYLRSPTAANASCQIDISMLVILTPSKSYRCQWLFCRTTMSKSKEVEDKSGQKPTFNFNTDEYDGRKNVCLERTFRFRNIAEFTALTNRERARMLRAQKEREEYEKYW